jgi:carboxypeptidase PM20D1
MIGGTDTRHYKGLTRNVYRFNPIVATTELVSGAHGTNERVRADDFVRAARFFAQLIRKRSVTQASVRHSQSCSRGVR